MLLNFKRELLRLFSWPRETLTRLFFICEVLLSECTLSWSPFVNLLGNSGLLHPRGFSIIVTIVGLWVILAQHSQPLF